MFHILRLRVASDKLLHVGSLCVASDKLGLDDFDNMHFSANPRRRNENSGRHVG